jgi:choline dehydrogenase-like flavoprotein
MGLTLMFVLASVLVVEYGDLADSWNLSIPYYGNFLQDASLMFTTPSVPQRGLGNRVFNLSMGATVGGGSTVNGMAYVRGARVDYDSWEDIGNRDWRWDEMFKYFKKVQTSA